MQTTQEQKTTKPTATTLAARTQERENVQAALAKAEADEHAARLACETDGSSAARDAWDAATKTRERLTRELDLARGKETRARTAHEAAVETDLRAELASVEREADTSVAMQKLLEGSVAFAREVDQLGAKKIEQDLAVVRAQKSAVARARAIAAMLGTTTTANEVRFDDARVVANVAIGKLRRTEGRDQPGIEAFLMPIAMPYVRERGGPLVEHPNCNEEAFKRAEAWLAKEKA